VFLYFIQNILPGFPNVVQRLV